jgi:predicted metalloprotease with PDZ domain
MIEHRVEIADAHAHLYRVTLSVPEPATGQVLSLPVWIPGSYMVRDFARHLSFLKARQGRRPVALTQLDKTRWQAACTGRGTLVVSYLVYAFDTSVRTAFLDAHRGFFNASSLCLCVEGREAQPQQLVLGALPSGWQVATTLRSLGTQRFEAADYAELIDHPVELGSFWRGSFTAGGVAHELVVAGALPSFDGARLLADLQRVCEVQIAFWHGPPSGRRRKAAERPPFDRYLFLLNTVEDGYGGLEHRTSTALLAARRDLPRHGSQEVSDGYVTLLGLASHEYFHAWNVKRLMPSEFAQLDLARENPTRLLWFFEGVTSYYDDLMLLRAGLVTPSRYLRLLARPVNALHGTPGRQVQSVAEASFDAWTKFYKTDENTPNATVSYYTKGSLVALLLDLALRRLGHTLDDALRRLWRQARGGPVTEDDIADALTAGLPAGAAAGLRAHLQAWVHGTGELPLAQALADAGVQVHEEAAPLAALLGLRLSESALTGVTVKSVLRGSAAERAGISAGDEVLAVSGWRLRRLEDARQWLAGAESFELLIARDQRVLALRVQPPATPAVPSWALSPAERPGDEAAALRRAWLGA